MLNNTKIQHLKDLSVAWTNWALSLALTRLHYQQISKLLFPNQLKKLWVKNSTKIWTATEN